MAEVVFNVAAAKSYIKRFANAVVLGKVSNLTTAQDETAFLTKVPLNTSFVYMIEVLTSADVKIGSVMFALTTGLTSHSDSIVTALGASTQAFVDSTEIIVSKNFITPSDTANVLVGIKIPTYGAYKYRYQVISSNRGVVTAVEEAEKVTTNYSSYSLAKGFLLGRPLFEEMDAFHSFLEWNSSYLYSPHDPVFYLDHLYYASNIYPPAVGEDPVSYPWKWVEIASAEIPPDVDPAEGMRTPQLFYRPSLTISNDTAAGLRAAHRDVGYQYPSTNSKVYHLDDDLLDQNQENSISSNIEVAEGEDPPIFVDKDMLGTSVLPFPAINWKPLKEKAKFYLGKFDLRKSLTLASGSNIFCYFFKYPTFTGEKHLAQITLASGEILNLYANRVDAGASLDGNSLALVSTYNGTTVTNKIFNSYPLLSDNWVQIFFKLDSTSITIYYRGGRETVLLQSSGLGATEFLINPSQEEFALDELLWDTTSSVAYSRYQEIYNAPLVWAAIEKDENWFVMHLADPTKISTNLFESTSYQNATKNIVSNETLVIKNKTIDKKDNTIIATPIVLTSSQTYTPTKEVNLVVDSEDAVITLSSGPYNGYVLPILAKTKCRIGSDTLVAGTYTSYMYSNGTWKRIKAGLPDPLEISTDTTLDVHEAAAYYVPSNVSGVEIEISDGYFVGQEITIDVFGTAEITYDNGENTVTDYVSSDKKARYTWNGTGWSSNWASIAQIYGYKEDGTPYSYTVPAVNTDREALCYDPCIVINTSQTVTPKASINYVVNGTGVTLTLSNGVYVGQEVCVSVLKACTITYTDINGATRSDSPMAIRRIRYTWTGIGWFNNLSQSIPIQMESNGVINNISVALSGNEGETCENVCVQATLFAADWIDNTQTINVLGVTALNTKVISPAPNSIYTADFCRVQCTGEGNGTLTFTCFNTPSEDLVMNIVIIG